MFTSDPAILLEPLGTCGLYRETPKQRHPYKTKIGNCFTYFHRDRESKQNEKTEEVVSIERERGNKMKKQLIKQK